MTITYAMTAAILFIGLLMMLADVRRKLDGSDHRGISLILIAATMLYVAMDCLWIVVYTAENFNRGLFIFLNFLFYLLYITLPYIWFLFTGHFAGSSLTDGHRGIVFALPWLFNLALVLLTMAGTGVLWVIGDAENRYTRGPLFGVFSKLNLVYYFMAVLVVLIRLFREKEERKRMLSVLGFSVIPALSVFIYTHWIPVDAIYPFQPCCFFLGVMFAYILLLSEEELKAEEEKIRLTEETKAAVRMADLLSSVGSLLTNMPAMTFSKEADTGRYLACNNSYAEYAKTTPGEIAGRTDYELFDPATAKTITESDRRALEMEEPYVSLEDVPDAEGMMHHLQTTKLTFTDESGRHCLLGMCVDVTEMTRIKAAEAEGRARQQELEEKVALQNQLLEQQADSRQQGRLITALASNYRSVYYLELDKDEGICYQAHSDVDGGLQPGERFKYLAAVTAYAENYVTEEHREAFLRFVSPDSIREGLKKDHVIAFRYIVHRHGRDSYEAVRFAGVRRPEDQGDKLINSVSACFADVDAETRRTLEQGLALRDALDSAEQANRAKTAFLSNMSHEIRTPMNAIIGINNIALDDPETPEKTRVHLEKIGTSAHHLLGIINDILDMSRIESGRMVIRNEEFCFPKVLEQVNTIISGQCREKGIDYECRTKGMVRDYYIGDDIKLRQVLINILGNAVKFTPEGGRVSFIIEAAARLEGKATLRFVISDTGIGMSEDYLPHIYDSFSQEDSSTTNRFGSTGLGMPITKSLVELMNGHIEVESEKGAGTTFTVTVTLTESDRQDENPAVPHLKDIGPRELSAPVPETADLRGRRILLAEDMAVNAEIMMMVLGMREMEADLAENGRIAVDMFASHPAWYYDAVLMDMRMPEMDGLEASRRIRGMDREDAKAVPIIALTANAFDEDVQRSMQAGLNAHLSKPVEPETLFGTLERLVK